MSKRTKKFNCFAHYDLCKSHDGLLEACRELVEVIEKWNNMEKVDFGDAFEQGCTAIAKAEGEHNGKETKNTNS